MSAHKPFVRPMTGWWLKNPFYIRYMIREATSVFVAIYALILLAGLLNLVSGEAAYNNWLAAMSNPLALLFHIIAIAAAIYHTVTWFNVAPKVAPILMIGKNRIPDRVITATQYVIAIIMYLLLFIIVWKG